MQRSRGIISIALGLAFQASFAYALTVNLPIEASLGAPPILDTQALNFAQIAVLGSPNTVGMYTDGVCDPELNTVCVTAGQPGSLTITAPPGNSINLDSISADANSWALSNDGGTLTIGIGDISSSFGSPLTTTPLLFSSGFQSTCNLILNPNETCILAIGGQVNDIVNTGNGILHSATINLTLTYF